MIRMLAQLFPLAALAGIVLAGVVAAWGTLWRARTLVAAAERRLAAANFGQEAALGLLQQRLETVEAELQEARQHPPAAVPTPIRRASLNLEKRSQALRMHRRGEPPAQIAATLELPLQEVELLLKVHRIVLRAI